MLNYIKEFRGINESILSKPSAPNAMAPRQDETSYWLFFNLQGKRKTDQTETNRALLYKHVFRGLKITDIDKQKLKSIR